jgi:membrane fusion protein (multidrug efflux system)
MKKNIVLAAILVMVAACGNPDKKAELDKLRQEYASLGEKIKSLEAELGDSALAGGTGKQRVVAVTEIKQQAFTHYIDVQGNIDAEENVSLSARTAGPVTKINVSVGQKVSKGQVLAEIDNAALAAGMEELKTSLSFATEVFKKQESLFKQQIGTEMQYLQAKNNKESLERKMASLNEQLDMSYIKSPINGVVDGIDIKLGQTIAPGVPCMRVVNLFNLKIKASIAESQAGKVKAGDNVLIRFPDINREISSRISYVSKVINPSSRTFDIEIKLPSSEEYHPNMVAVLKIADYEKAGTFIVPVNTVQHADGEKFVFISESREGKHIARKTVIETGRTYGGQAEVLSGLKENDKVITVGFQDLNDGDEIKL